VDKLSLRVRWPSRRIVNVQIDVRPLAGPGDHIRKLRSFVPQIDNDALSSRDDFLRFLSDITRPEADGATIRTWMFENRLSDLYELLALEGPQGAPIPIQLPSDD